MIKSISSNINALTDDSFKMNYVEIHHNLDDPRKSLIKNLNEIANEKTVVKRRRIRKIIDPIVLVHISDMILVLSSEEYFRKYSRK